MGVIDIDVICLKSLQRVIAGGDDVLWAKSWALTPEGDLGGDDELATVLALEPAADDRLGLSTLVAFLPLAIDICGVDEVAPVALIGV